MFSCLCLCLSLYSLSLSLSLLLTRSPSPSPSPRRSPLLSVNQVEFEVDVNGILSISASEESSGAAESITITSDQGRLSEEEIKEIIAQAKLFEEEDRVVRERVDAKNQLESFAYSVKNSLDDEENKMAQALSAEDAETVRDAVAEAIEWLEENSDSAEKEDFEEQKTKLQDVVEPLFGGGDAAEEEEDDMDEHDEL